MVSRLHRWTYQHVDALVAISPESCRAVEKIGIPRGRIFLFSSPIPDALLEEDFDRTEIREKLGLVADDKPIVVYTGKVYPGQREIELILEAAAVLPDYRFLFTGGKDTAVQFYNNWCESRQIRNAIFTGFIDDSTRIKDYQRAADVLVSYYTSHDHALAFNFPQKIAEYMCARSPIVTPDHPATRGVLNAENAIFVKPDDPDSLATGIRLAVEDRDYSRSIAEQARKDAAAHTYSRRTRHLVEFFSTIVYEGGKTSK